MKYRSGLFCLFLGISLEVAGLSLQGKQPISFFEGLGTAEVEAFEKIFKGLKKETLDRRVLSRLVLSHKVNSQSSLEERMNVALMHGLYLFSSNMILDEGFVFFKKKIDKSYFYHKDSLFEKKLLSKKYLEAFSIPWETVGTQWCYTLGKDYVFPELGSKVDTHPSKVKKLRTLLKKLGMGLGEGTAKALIDMTFPYHENYKNYFLNSVFGEGVNFILKTGEKEFFQKTSGFYTKNPKNGKYYHVYLPKLSWEDRYIVNQIREYGVVSWEEFESHHHKPYKIWPLTVPHQKFQWHLRGAKGAQWIFQNSMKYLSLYLLGHYGKRETPVIPEAEADLAERTPMQRWVKEPLKHFANSLKRLGVSSVGMGLLKISNSYPWETEVFFDELELRASKEEAALKNRPEFTVEGLVYKKEGPTGKYYYYGVEG